MVQDRQPGRMGGRHGRLQPALPALLPGLPGGASPAGGGPGRRRRLPGHDQLRRHEDRRGRAPDLSAPARRRPPYRQPRDEAVPADERHGPRPGDGPVPGGGGALQVQFPRRFGSEPAGMGGKDRSGTQRAAAVPGRPRGRGARPWLRLQRHRLARQPAGPPGRPGLGLAQRPDRPPHDLDRLTRDRCRRRRGPVRRTVGACRTGFSRRRPRTPARSD